jgi:hypothetical protein
MRKLFLLAAVALAGLWTATVVSATGQAATSSSPVLTRTVGVGQRGKLAVGHVLRAPVPAGAVHARFQWLRCNIHGRGCVPIRHATRRFYRARPADLNHTLRARITWRGRRSVTTAATPQVGRRLPQNTSLPTISDGGQGGGTLSGPIVGDVLTGTNGTWTGAVRYTYQWEDCDAAGSNCAAIAGATARTYTLVDSDVDHTLVFVVTAYNY